MLAIESGAPIYLQGLAPLSLLLTYSLEDGGAVVEQNVPLVTVKLVSQSAEEEETSSRPSHIDRTCVCC